MSLGLISFIAGFLTVLAPCSLFLLPTILVGSSTAKDPLRPWFVVGSLGASVFLFTLLIKGTSLAFAISTQTWEIFSGALLGAIGINLLFPHLWEKISTKGNFSRTRVLLVQGHQTEGTWGAILMGAALGPVFSTCSPTFAILLATVLPGSFWSGVWNIGLFVIGMMLPFLLLGLGGQRAMKQFRFFANPNGIFKKSLGLVLIAMGFMVATGFQKTIEQKIIENGYWGPVNFEQELLESRE